MLSLVDIGSLLEGPFRGRVVLAGRLVAPHFDDPNISFEDAGPGARLAKQIGIGSLDAFERLVLAVASDEALAGFAVMNGGDLDCPDSVLLGLVEGLFGEVG